MVLQIDADTPKNRRFWNDFSALPGLGMLYTQCFRSKIENLASWLRTVILEPIFEIPVETLFIDVDEPVGTFGTS